MRDEPAGSALVPCVECGRNIGDSPKRVVMLGGIPGDTEWRFCSGDCFAAYGTRQAEEQLARFVEKHLDS